jgi:lysozyme family protein
LEKLVRAFYKAEFWNSLNLDGINDQRICNELFDTGVNCGTGVAAMFLQRALNVTNRNQKDYPDLPLTATVGPKTLQAVNNHPRPLQLLKVLNVLQGAKYINICEANKSQEGFMSSWMSRVAV